MTRVPFVDLAAQTREVRPEIDAAIADVVDASEFVLGKQVSSFEEEYGRYLEVRHCVGVGNGTDALEILLAALGVGRGDEVILPANTFVATAEAVLRVGARPVLVDVVPGTWLMDMDQALAAVGPRTRAVLPVHLYGQCAEVERLDALPDEVRVVEDAAQAQGARRFGRRAGGLGDGAGTSFYPGKNLGAWGDAGALLTDDDEVARRARMIANHGSETRYVHELMGRNSRLDSLQAVVLKAKLSRLDAWNQRRRSAAAAYGERLGWLEDGLPVTAEGNEHVWHLYVVQVPARDEVMARLSGSGIGTGIHYPVPLHLQPALRELGYRRGQFPVAERAAERMLSLPMHPHLSEDMVDLVARELAKGVSAS